MFIHTTQSNKVRYMSNIYTVVHYKSKKNKLNSLYIGNKIEKLNCKRQNGTTYNIHNASTHDTLHKSVNSYKEIKQTTVIPGQPPLT